MQRVKSFLVAGLLTLSTAVGAEQATEITVYRSPACGCCEKWLSHLQQNNFAVKDSVTDDMQAIKTKHGVTADLASCHTALVNGYVIEGHVPAADIRTLLKARPNVIGIAVPGMPAGTPGMEMGAKKSAYDVVAFDAQHHTQPVNSYKGD